MKKESRTDLLTVSEFAKKANISRQAVYKKIDNSLQKYVVKVDNKIMLKIQGLEEFSVNEFDNQVDKKCQPIDNQVDNQVDNSDKEIIAILKKELEEKNNQIKSKDLQISMLQKLLDQEQQLRLVETNRILEISQKDQEEEKRNFWSKILKRKHKS